MKQFPLATCLQSCGNAVWLKRSAYVPPLNNHSVCVLKHYLNYNSPVWFFDQMYSFCQNKNRMHYQSNTNNSLNNPQVCTLLVLHYFSLVNGTTFVSARAEWIISKKKTDQRLLTLSWSASYCLSGMLGKSRITVVLKSPMSGLLSAVIIFVTWQTPFLKFLKSECSCWSGGNDCTWM